MGSITALQRAAGHRGGGTPPPPPPLRSNVFSGTDGTAVTTGNSGGSSGDAFSSVFLGTGTSVIYSTTHAKSVSASMAITEPATYAGASARWTGLALAAANVWMRLYVWIPALPGAGASADVAAVRTAADGTSSRLRIMATTGLITVVNGAGSEILTARGTVPVATGQWIRLEWRVKSSTTVGEVEWRLFNTTEATTPSDTGSATAQVLGADSDRALFGFTGTTGPPSTTWWWDDIAVSTAGWIGPSASGGGGGGSDGLIYFDSDFDNVTTVAQRYVESGGAGVQTDGTSGAAALVTDPFLGVGKCARLSITYPSANSFERCQLVHGQTLDNGGGPLTFGYEFWTGRSLGFTTAFPSGPPASWASCGQMYGPPFAGSPDMEMGHSLTVANTLRGNQIDGAQDWSFAFTKGVWIDIVEHWKLSSAVGVADGIREVWMTQNGTWTMVYSDTTLATITAPNKDGPERDYCSFYADGSPDAWPSGTHSHYFKDHRIGSNAAAVNPATYGQAAPV